MQGPGDSHCTKHQHLSWNGLCFHTEFHWLVHFLEEGKQITPRQINLSLLPCVLWVKITQSIWGFWEQITYLTDLKYSKKPQKRHLLHSTSCCLCFLIFQMNTWNCYFTKSISLFQANKLPKKYALRTHASHWLTSVPWFHLVCARGR